MKAGVCLLNQLVYFVLVLSTKCFLFKMKHPFIFRTAEKEQIFFKGTEFNGQWHTQVIGPEFSLVSNPSSVIKPTFRIPNPEKIPILLVIS